MKAGVLVVWACNTCVYTCGCVCPCVLHTCECRMCWCVCMCCAYVCVPAWCLCVYARLPLCVHMRVCLYMRVHLCMPPSVCACTCVYTCVCACPCVFRLSDRCLQYTSRALRDRRYEQERNPDGCRTSTLSLHRQDEVCAQVSSPVRMVSGFHPSSTDPAFYPVH